MKAIISDIHGNLEALLAVLDDIARQRVTEIYCLGDVIGYGPNPRECLDLVQQCKVVLLGNHDYAALADTRGFNPAARRALHWTCLQLDQPIDPPEVIERRWKFLAELPMTHREGDVLYVHASPRNPLVEYVFPEDVHNQQKMDGVFAEIERCCFVGHTHVPGVFTEDYLFRHPEDIKGTYRLDHRKTLCNVGSVGQPRDGSWRACYVMFDGTTIVYRRVNYDIQTTVKKIKAVPDLENLLTP
jgi:diadenosine tetraphosphatase ApaH/serine/threonine PP2A family protein phosphatase